MVKDRRYGEGRRGRDSYNMDRVYKEEYRRDNFKLNASGKAMAVTRKNQNARAAIAEPGDAKLARKGRPRGPFFAPYKAFPAPR